MHCLIVMLDDPSLDLANYDRFFVIVLGISSHVYNQMASMASIAKRGPVQYAMISRRCSGDKGYAYIYARCKS